MSMRKIKNAVNNTTGELIYFKGHAKATFMSDGSTVEDAINSIEIPSLDEYVTETELNDKGFLTEHQDISHLASRNWVESQGYAHQEDLLEISFNDIQDSPISIDDSSELNITDENGNIGMKVSSEAVYAKDFIADSHTLSNKVDKSDLSAYVKESEIQDTVSKAETAYNWGNHANAGYLKTETPETYYLELPIDEETGQCLMSGSLTQEQFESISNCSVLIVRTAHMDSEEVLASEDITFNWKISQTEQYEGGSKAYAYSNLHPSIMEGCFVLYAIIFNQYEGVCSYELTKKRFVVDTEITDPTDAFISTNSVYELDLSSGTTDENGLIVGNITEEEFNQITISKNIIVNTGQFKFSLTQKCTFTDMLVFYGNIYYDGITQRLVLNVKTDGNEYMYMVQLVPIVYELDLSSGTTLENGYITGNITKEEFDQIIEAESLAIKLGDHKVTFNQKSTSDRQSEYLFYGIYNDYEKEKIVLLIVLHDDNDYVYEIRTQELGGSSAYPEVNHGTSDTTTLYTLTPNTFHVWDEVQVLTLVLDEEIANVANEYLFQFTSGSEPTTLTLPDSIKFNSDFTVEANKIYQISILNGLGTVMSWGI